jgi:hypothetical protein
LQIVVGRIFGLSVFLGVSTWCFYRLRTTSTRGLNQFLSDLQPVHPNRPARDNVRRINLKLFLTMQGVISRRVGLSELPADCVAHILQNFTLLQRVNAGQVSKMWLLAVCKIYGDI